ncbi:FK506-binding protein 59 [Diplonema papillatum]|nr:FK506-binding protein 59 [Diplonema papillatum]
MCLGKLLRPGGPATPAEQVQLRCVEYSNASFDAVEGECVVEAELGKGQLEAAVEEAVKELGVGGAVRVAEEKAALFVDVEVLRRDEKASLSESNLSLASIKHRIERLKEEGNFAIKHSSEEALGYYERAIRTARTAAKKLPRDKTSDETVAGALEPLLVSCLSNLALCCYKLHDYKRAIDTCDQVLATRTGGSSAKIFFRRGQCRAALHEYPAALHDMQEAATLGVGTPAAAEAAKEIARIGALAKQAEKTEKQMYSKMFGT